MPLSKIHTFYDKEKEKHLHFQKLSLYDQLLSINVVALVSVNLYAISVLTVRASEVPFSHNGENVRRSSHF